jgi:hypothetical protein
MTIPSFRTRIQHETAGWRRTVFKNAERKRLSKTAHREFFRITSSIDSFNAKSTTDAGRFTVWHIQLKLSKEMVLAACSLLGFLDLETDLEELKHDAPLDIVPKIDAMIDECQDAIVDNTDEERWKPIAARDEKTKKVLTKVADQMTKVFSKIFASKRELKIDDRYEIMYMCCALFDAADDLVKSTSFDCDCLELDSELEGLFEDAVSKCDDQTLDAYLDEEDDDDDE